MHEQKIENEEVERGGRDAHSPAFPSRSSLSARDARALKYLPRLRPRARTRTASLTGAVPPEFAACRAPVPFPCAVPALLARAAGRRCIGLPPHTRAHTHGHTPASTPAPGLGLVLLDLAACGGGTTLVISRCEETRERQKETDARRRPLAAPSTTTQRTHSLHSRRGPPLFLLQPPQHTQHVPPPGLHGPARPHGGRRLVAGPVHHQAVVRRA